MGTAIGVGIGIGIGIALTTLIFVVFVGINQGTPTLADIPILEDIPALDFDDPQFAIVKGYYDDTDNRLTVFLTFTDEDGKNVKADGTGTITVTELDYSSEKVGRPYSYDVEFEKDGFVTWTDNLGVKHTEYRFYINQEFAGRALSWDVSMDIILEDGLYWADVDNRFTSRD